MKKKLLTAGMFLALLAGLLGTVFPVLAWKDTAGTPYLSSAQQLYATGDDCIDLVFLGSSHVFCNIDPDWFWQQGGIAAFDLSVAAMDTTSAEYHLRELFKTQSPQVVCLDLYSLLLGREDEAFVYRNYLTMRPSLDFVQAVLDYAPQGGAGDYLLRWPIVHTRYRELQAFDFVQYQPSRFGRGYDYYFIANAVTQDPAAVATTRVTELSAEGRAWLDAICALCQEHGSALVATITPMIVTEDQQAVLNGAKEYLQERGVDCLDLNLCAEALGLDYAADFRDEEHLNAYGAQKVSEYLMQELCARYTFPDRRGDARYALWEENARYAAHRWALEALLQTPENDPAATLQALAACPALAAAVNVPPGLTGPGTDLAALLAQLGVPEEALAAGGQWIVQDGRVLAAVPAGSGGSASVDLDAVSTLSITDNAALLVNGVAQVYPLGTFTLAAYDPYEAEVTLLRTFL